MNLAAPPTPGVVVGRWMNHLALRVGRSCGVLASARTDFKRPRVFALVRCALLGFMALVASPCLGQTTSPDEPILAIRPRVTDTTRIVPVGRLQLEAGADFNYGGVDVLRRDTYGLVLRYGLAPRLEARFEAPNYSNFDIPYNDGFGNTNISVSWLLGRSGPVWFAILPRLTLPGGVEFRRPDEVSPSLFLTAEAELGDVWLLSSTIGGLHERFDGDSYDVMRATLCAERYIDARFSGFAEYVGTYIKHSTPGHAANVGARLRISPREQVDFHWVLPIDDTFTPRTLGLGYSVRL